MTTETKTNQELAQEILARLRASRTGKVSLRDINALKQIANS